MLRGLGGIGRLITAEGTFDKLHRGQGNVLIPGPGYALNTNGQTRRRLTRAHNSGRPTGNIVGVHMAPNPVFVRIVDNVVGQVSRAE